MIQFFLAYYRFEYEANYYNTAFITLGSKCKLQMGPLLLLGPVIPLVPSTVEICYEVTKNSDFCLESKSSIFSSVL